jgi:hypothetical protein
MTSRVRTALPRGPSPGGCLARRAGGGYLARTIWTAPTDVDARECPVMEAEVSA